MVSFNAPFFKPKTLSRLPGATRLCKPRTSPWTIVRFVAESQVRLRLQAPTRPKEVGIWLREELVALGPAFIKFGQFLSTRPDLIEKEITAELSKLQDSIEETPFDEIKPMLEDGYQDKLWPFDSIDEKSIASASIGQVHRARLKGTGKRVVIKVQKPCVAHAIREDLETLRRLNHMAFKWIQPMRMQEIDSVLAQYEQFLSAELDYHLELKNMLRFRKAYRTSNTNSRIPVTVPRPLPDLSRSNILVMEDVPSTKVTDLAALDAMGVNRATLASQLVSIFLLQIVEFGIIHCDPHPGNVGVAADGETLVLYDFGNVVRLNKKFRDNIKNLVFSIYQKDVDEFVELLIELQIIRLDKPVPSTTDLLEIKSFFTYFFTYLESVDIQALKDSIQNNEWFEEMKDINIRIDDSFMALVRVFTLLDGTCTLLDPKFSYIDALAPYTSSVFQDVRFFEYRARKDLSKLMNYPAMVKSTDQNMLRLSKRVRSINRDVNATWMVMLALHAVETLPGSLSGGGSGTFTPGSASSSLTLSILEILPLAVVTVSWLLWQRQRD